MSTTTRTIQRGANPFAPLIKQQNIALAPDRATDIYEPLTARGQRSGATAQVQQAVQALAQRLAGQKFQLADFGELLYVPIHLLDINKEIQRDEDPAHQAKIIVKFDPRIALPIMATKLPNGRFSVWEGQQTSCVIYNLYQAGLIDGDQLVQVKAFDSEQQVPGTALQAEAVANYGFRQINGGMRKGIDAYTLHRSRVQGVRLYGSEFQEDVQSHMIQCVLEKNNMFPAKAIEGRGHSATPGMVTYIHGLNTIAGHGQAMPEFEQHLKDLDWALAWHNRYYSSEKGVDGGFILAFGRLAYHARTGKTPVTLDSAVEQDLFEMFRDLYGSPKGFHKECHARLERFQTQNNLNRSWSDNCLTPILVLDYYDTGRFNGRLQLPQVPDLVTYSGI